MKGVSPTKDSKTIKTLLEGIYREDVPGGLLAYGLCKKEGRTMGSNQRLLVLNEASKIIGYCNDPPKEIPVGNAAALKMKYRGLLMTCQTRIPSDSKNNLIVNVELEPNQPGEKPKKDRWVMIFGKNQHAKQWDDLIKSTKQKIRDSEIRAAKPALQPGAMTRTEMPFNPPPNAMSTIAPRVEPREEPLPIDSFIRQAHGMGQESLNVPANNNMVQSRSDLFESRGQPVQPSEQNPRTEPKNDPPRQVTSIYGGGGSLPADSIRRPPQGVGVGGAGGLEYIPELEQRRSSYNPNPPSTIPRAGQSNIGASSIKPKPSELMIPGQNPPKPGPTNLSNNGQKYPQPGSEIPPGNSTFGSKVQPPPQGPGTKGSQPSRYGGSQNEQLAPPKRSQNSGGLNWNSNFATTNDPVGVILDFQRAAEELIVRIVNQLGMERSIRKIQPSESTEGYFKYQTDSMDILLALDNQTEDSVRAIKNEWRNYNYILTATRNQGVIRVPLACIVEYKGFTALAKALIVDGSAVAATAISNELAEIERLTKVSRQVFTKDDRIEFIKARIDGGDVVYLWNLLHFIPVDLYSSRQLSQLRQETIETLDRPVGSGPIYFSGSRKLDKSQLTSQGLREAGDTMRSYSEQVLGLLQSFEIVVLNTKELVGNMHLNGANVRTLGEMHKRCRNLFIKKVLVSEMVGRACAQLLRQELQHNVLGLAIGPTSKNTSAPSEAGLLDLCFDMLNNLVSSGPESDRIWRSVASLVKSKFQVSFSKEDIAVGFFLSALFEKANLTFSYQLLLKDKEYLRASNLLKRDFLRGFNVKSRSYQIGWTDFALALEELLNTKPNQQGCDKLIQMLGLDTHTIPAFCEGYGYDHRVRLYLSHFINSEMEMVDRATSETKAFKHLRLYDRIVSEPPTFRTIRLALQAIKWELNLLQYDQAERLYETVQDLVTFWGGQSHPLLGELYDVFAAYNGQQGKYEQSMDFAKSSIQNAVKLAGSNSLVAANKYYEYGLLCFKAGRKDDALANFIKTRQINQTYNVDESRQHANMCMKMSLLYLNLNQNSECLARALECLKIVEQLPDNELELINIYELLFRQYEITEQKIELTNLATTVAKKLKDARDPKIVERMLKIIVYPSLHALSTNSKKQLFDLLLELKQKRATRLQEWKKQAYQSFYVQSEQENFSLELLQQLTKADRHLNDITGKKLINGYSGPDLQPNSESQRLLHDIDVLCCLVGENFLLGLLREDE